MQRRKTFRKRKTRGLRRKKQRGGEGGGGAGGGGAGGAPTQPETKSYYILAKKTRKNTGSTSLASSVTPESESYTYEATVVNETEKEKVCSGADKENIMKTPTDGKSSFEQFALQDFDPGKTELVTFFSLDGNTLENLNIDTAKWDIYVDCP